MIRVDRDIRVGEEYFEPDAPLAHIVQRLDEGVARREALALQLSIDPFEEEPDQRFAVRQSMQLLGFTDEFEVADLFLDGVQRLDLLQRLGGAGGFRGQRLEETSAAVRATSSVIDPGLLGI